MRRGEVWWAAMPLTGGPRKRRPFLVVSDDAFNGNDRYPKVLAVHLTTVRRVGGLFDWEVEFPRGAAGLGRPSIAKCAEVYTLWKEHFSVRAGTASAALLRRVDRALALALGLPVPTVAE